MSLSFSVLTHLSIHSYSYIQNSNSIQVVSISIIIIMSFFAYIYTHSHRCRTVPIRISISLTLSLLSHTVYVHECLPVCMYVHQMYAVPEEARRGEQVSWKWNYR